jgi:4-carboxymuconolactone decarboxylase
MTNVSLSRLPAVRREDLDEQGKKAYDTVSDPSHRLYAKLVGPPGFWLHIAELLVPIREINWTLRRKDLGLEPPLRELTTLVTARENDSQYEWTAHEPYALKAGVDPAIVDVIKHRKPLTGVGEKEAAIIQFGRELFQKRKVTPETYQRALSALGQKGVVHMIALMSNYTMTATIFHAIDQQLRPEQKPLLPMDQKT